MYHEREAELQARVDRARVRVAQANASERGSALAALRRFSADVAALGMPGANRPTEGDAICEPKDGMVHA